MDCICGRPWRSTVPGICPVHCGTVAYGRLWPPTTTTTTFTTGYIFADREPVDMPQVWDGDNS